MFRETVCVWLAVITLTVSSPVVAQSVTYRDGCKDELESVLHAERSGAEQDRADRLRSLLRTSPDFAPARWQSGYMKVQDAWLPFDRAMDGDANDDTLMEYRRQRADAARTVAGQWDLAEWCRKHGLDEQRRAHLTAVLDIDPDHTWARKALGFVRIGPVWQSKQEQTRHEEEAQRIQRNLERWQPRIARICQDLMSRKVQRSLAAVKRLEAISEPSAIPALEWGIAQTGPAMANLVIDRLGDMTHTDATLALARQAVFSQWKSTRDSAAEKLKSRKFEHFVPAVLSLVPTPIRSRRFLYIDADGSLLYRHVLYQETTNQRRLASWTHGRSRRDSIQSWLNNLVGGGIQSLESAAANHSARARFQNDTIDVASGIGRRQQHAIEDANRILTELNQRVDQLLSTITESTSGHPLEAWWRWWDIYSDMTRFSSSQHKRLVCSIQETMEWESVQNYEHKLRSPDPPPSRNCECLTAGTPIWTERGFMAIENVQVGDRVLAKDIETGELKYKPVLKTTVRTPPQPLSRIGIGPRTLTLTQAHPLWISGKGWTKARDIKDRMLLHDLHGTTPAQPAGTVPPEKVYNLIVADFHTYFVGEALILSHDPTPNELTNVLVPGLAER